MSNNGQEVEILRITQKEGKMSIKFNNKVPQAIISHALRITNLHYDNILISQQQPTVTPVSPDILNRLRGKHG